MVRLVIILFLYTLNLNSQQNRLIPNPIRNIPRWVRNEFSTQHFDNRYRVIYQLYPYYLQGDFNGDGRRDVVIQIREISSGKIGFAIFHGKTPQVIATPVTIFGAGNTFGKAKDDFSWVNLWNIIQKRDALKNPDCKSIQRFYGDVISIGKRDSISSLIYWDGRKYLYSKNK